MHAPHTSNDRYTIPKANLLFMQPALCKLLNWYWQNY